MSNVFVDVVICDADGSNCGPSQYVALTDLQTSSFAGLPDPGTPEYSALMTSVLTLFALAWAFKSVIRFIRGKR